MKYPGMARTAVLGVGIALIAAPALSHGGQYRGPGDIVPPGTKPGSRGGKSNGPGSPGGGGKTGDRGGTGAAPRIPTGGGFGPPSGGTRNGTRTGGVSLSLADDLGQWQFWWEFNKAPYLQLKDAVFGGAVHTGSDDWLIGRGFRPDAVDSLAPSTGDIRRIRSALKKALVDRRSNRDIASACMVALARIGRDPSVLPLYRKFLRSSDQEIHETAALAIGIATLEEGIPDLVALARDSDEGRRLVDRPEVGYRTRSFACYGLGLTAWAKTDTAIKERTFTVMRELLSDGSASRRDVKVAALNAIRLLRPRTDTERGRKLFEAATAFLESYLDRRNEFSQIRAHAYTALARLCRDAGERRPSLIARLAAELRARRRSWIHQSAVLALGQTARAEDEAAGEALRHYAVHGRDEQARSFAAIALGRMGGSRNRDFLLRRLSRPQTPTLQRPWLALGLAVLDHAARQANASRPVDVTAAEAIARQFERTKNPLLAAAYGIALGLMRHREAGHLITRRMLRYRSQDEPCGYLAVSLGLMRHRSAVADIAQLVDAASRRERTLTQGSIALGLLGDKELARRLVRRLREHGSVAVLSAVAKALGFIGDRFTIGPLIETLENHRHKNLPRAFAAAALGLIGDKESLPWNSKIAVGINYRANVETLTTRAGTGVLDIL